MSDILTTSSINSLINNYQATESSRVVTPLQTRKDKYTTQSSAYSTLVTKLNALKTELTSLNLTGADSAFSYKKATSSNSTFISSSTTSTSLAASYEMRVSQLAKKDIALSGQFASADASTLTGNHTFNIVAGDGSGGQFVSNVEVNFSGTETNKSAIEKIQNAINADKAVVKSDSKTGTDSYLGGASTFKINLNGTEKTITVDGSASTYSALMDSLVQSINDNVDGVTAEKIVDPLDPLKFKLSLTADDSSKYISISHDTGFNLASDLNIIVTKEKGASGIVTASSFTPATGFSQLNITAKESGLDYRVKELSDGVASSALSSFNMNLGTTRPVFDQVSNTPGFIYSDITSTGNQLNAKINFNGLDLQRNSNTITDLADGLTLNLNSTMAVGDKSVTIAVANDFTTIKGKVDSFISKFNDLYNYLKTNNSFTSGIRGSLYGDSNAQSLLSYLSSSAYSTVPGLKTSSLSSIGISFDSTNGLTLSDSSKLQSKINENPDQVASLFNSTTGISQTLLTHINPYLGSQGYLTNQITSLNSNAKSIDDRIKSAGTRIDKSAELLRNQYQRLQAQYATLLTTQSYFGSSTG